MDNADLGLELCQTPCKGGMGGKQGQVSHAHELHNVDAMWTQTEHHTFESREFPKRDVGQASSTQWLSVRSSTAKPEDNTTKKMLTDHEGRSWTQPSHTRAPTDTHSHTASRERSSHPRTCCNGGELTERVPIRRDYFDALQDGRGLAAILAFYRPDLVSLSQMSFATDAEAVAAAPATITAALHSASRASCPCPLSADDVAAKSALLRPVRVALMCPLTACGCVRTCVRASLCLYLCVHVGWSV